MTAVPGGIDRFALIAANPFPGLRSFKPGEADRFFGRGQQVGELVARLAEVPLLAVSGASGCGKSSLVLAGLINELKRRHEQDFDTDWRPVVMRPGNRPIANLAAPLAAAMMGRAEITGHAADDEALAQRTASLVGQLRLGGLGLVEAVRQSRLPVGAAVLVVVDQFEEIFRFKRMADPDEATAFVKLLLQATADPASPVSVVITLRSDTLGDCADFRDLPEAVSRGGYLVPRLKREQRKEAIVKPVELRGAKIAPRLVQRLLNDVSDDFDDLPVMQHALARTWQRWAEVSGGSRPIDIEDYEAIGGAAFALSNHADEACRSLAALGEPGGVVERVFRALTERIAEGTEVRRPLEFTQLCAVCGDGTEQGVADVTQVVERYRRPDTAFLVPGAEWPLAANPVIDISHESLIRQWTRLRGWVVAEAEAEAALGRLVEDSRSHATEGGELLRGHSLEHAREWLRANRPNAAWLRLCIGGSAEESAERFKALQIYIDKSVAAELHARKRERRRKQALVALVASVVAVSVGAAVVGRTLQRQAQSREMVSRAVLAMAQDPVRSAQYALAALDLDRSNDRAEYALRQSMSSLEIARTEQIKRFDAPITDARYNDDGSRLVVAGGHTVWLLDPASLNIVAQVATPAGVVKAWQLGQQIISYTDDSKVHLQGLDGQVRANLSCGGDGNATTSVAYSGASKGRQGDQAAQLAVGCSNGQLLLWEFGSGGLLAREALRPGDDHAGTVLALGFSGDGQYLASADSAGMALVWKRGVTDRPWIGQPGDTPLRHKRAIRDISFHPTETSLLATASDDRSARVWTLDLDGRGLVPDDPKNDQKGMHTLRHDRAVVGVRFVRRADDPTALMTRSDKRVFFWSSETTFDARSHNDWVTDFDPSDDGELIASASGDGTAHLWLSRAATAIAVLRGHRDEVTRAFFNAEGNQVITTSRDRTLRQWRLTRPVLLAANRQWQLSATIDPHGQRALICGEATGDAAHQCRLSPLADLASRTSIDEDWLQPVPAEMVSQGSFSSDGALVMGLGVSQDIYQASGPLLWDAGSRRSLNVPWLKQWKWARFVAGRAELMTLRQSAENPGTFELAVWPQGALTRVGSAPDQPLWTTRVERTLLSAVDASADGRWLAAISGDKVLLWDRQAPDTAARELLGHDGDVRHIAFRRDSRALVTASADRTARVWRLGDAAGTPVVLKGGHSAALTAAAFSADGRQVVTSSSDNSLRLWDATTGKELSAIHRHADAVNAVSFGPDDKALLSASDDGTVRLDSCEFCALPIAQLQSKARKAMLLIDPLEDERPAAASWFSLPAWLGSKP